MIGADHPPRSNVAEPLNTLDSVQNGATVVESRADDFTKHEISYSIWHTSGSGWRRTTTRWLPDQKQPKKPSPQSNSRLRAWFRWGASAG